MTQIVAIVLLLIYMWVLFYITFQNNNLSLFKNKEVYAWWDGQMKSFKMLEIIFGNTKTSTSVFCFVLYFIFFTFQKYMAIFEVFIMHYLLFSEEYKLRSQLNFKELLVSIHHFEKLFLFDLIIWLNKVGISKKKSIWDGNKMMIRSISSFIKAVRLHCWGAKKGYK